MAVKVRRVVPAVLVLLVLFASQTAYVAQAQDRPSGHCAGAEPAPAESCPLPLWLTCCDDQAAVGTALHGPGPGSLLALPLDSAFAGFAPSADSRAAKVAAIPPDTPLRRSVVLLI